MCGTTSLMAGRPKSLFLVVLLSVLLFIPWIGQREIHTSGEAREALAIRSTVEGGSSILARGYGSPLYQWLGGAAASIEGSVSEFSARIPSSLASVLFVLAFFLFILARLGERTAFLSSMMLVTSAEWFHYSIVSRVDLLFASTIAGSLLCAFADFEKAKRTPSVGTILLSSLAVLSNGLVGIVLPALIIAAFYLARGRSYRSIFTYLGVYAVFASILPIAWYIANGRDDFRNLSLSENILRFLGSGGDGEIPHGRSVLAFYGVVVLGLFPWSLLIMPELFERGFKNFKKWRRENTILSFETKREKISSFFKASFWRKVSLDLTSWVKTRSAETSDLKLFSICAILVTLLLFSISPGRSGANALPCYPFIAILVSSYLLHLTRLRHHYIAWALFILALATFLLCIAVTLAAFLDIKSLWWVTLSSSPKISIINAVLLVLCLVFTVWVFAKIFYGSRRSYVPAALSLFYSVFLLIHASISPLVSESLSAKGFSRAISREVDTSLTINSFMHDFYGLSFYLNQPIKTIETGFREGMWMILYEKNLEQLRKALPSGISPEIMLRSARQIENFGDHVVAVRLNMEHRP